VAINPSNIPELFAFSSNKKNTCCFFVLKGQKVEEGAKINLKN